MDIGQEYATLENAPHVERVTRVNNTRNRGGKMDWFMFAPPYSKQRLGIVCGVCKTEISDGTRHCPHCYEGIEEK